LSSKPPKTTKELSGSILVHLTGVSIGELACLLLLLFLIFALIGFVAFLMAHEANCSFLLIKLLHSFGGAIFDEVGFNFSLV
jgi:hypothetical protein